MKSIFLIVLSCIFGFGLQAQSVEITPTYGYQFGGKLLGIRGDLRIESAPAYGVNLEVGSDNMPLKITAFWLRQDSRATYQEFGQREEYLWDVATEYFQIGATREGGDGTFVPFGTFTLGATNFSPKTDDYSDELRFSATFGGGVKIFPTEKIGIRLHIRMLLPFQYGGGGLWCGSGGCSVNAGASTTFIQGEAGGGIVLKLN
jgi:hypothetical protein